MTASPRSPVVPLLVALLLAGLWWARSGSDRPAPPTAPDPSYGDFTLQTADGPLSLSDFAGRATVLYFGYTACPDICPTTLSTVTSAWHLLPDDVQTQAAVLFVSVDPDRDTPARLATYLGHFSDDFHAGTLPEPAIRRVAADWGVRYRKADLGGSAMGYAVDHTTDTFLVGPQGELRRTLPHGTPAADLAAAWERAATGHR